MPKTIRGTLTPNACLVCRRKRTKCDGERPCRRCKARDENCEYEDKKWRTKDHLRSEIERLQTEQRQGRELLRALTGNDPKRWDMVLGRMRAGDPPEAIAKWILDLSSKPLPKVSSGSLLGLADDNMAPLGPDAKRRLAGEQSSPFLGQPLASPFLGPSQHGCAAGPSTGPYPVRRFSFDPRPSIFPPPLYLPPSDAPRRQYFPPPESVEDPIPHTWTRITSDTRFVQRLLARFFSSSLPYLSMVSQRHFMQDFREANSRYCSEALVNAVLGLACRVAAASSQLVSRVSFADAFLGEARGLLAKERDRDTLPCIQALGVLAVAEMAQGNEDEAGDLARESVKACVRLFLRTQVPNQDHDDEFRTVRAFAYCGGFSLIRILRLVARDLDAKTGPLFMRMYPNSANVGDSVPEIRVERGISLQVHFFDELQYCPPLARFVYEVTEATHTFATYNHSHPMPASDLDHAFNKCLDSRRQVADLAPFGADAGPDVLLAQIWYNFCLLSLLQPFIAGPVGLVGGLPPSLTGDTTPRTVCGQASEAIISLTSTFQARFSLTYLPPLLPYMVFAAILDQLSLAAALPLHQGKQREDVAASPGPLSPDPTCGGQPCSASATQSNFLQAGASIDPSGPSGARLEPSSSGLSMQTPMSAGRRNSGFSASSTCFSNDDQTRRPSVSSFVSSTTTSGDTDGPLSSESVNSVSDTLPAFTSRPRDLVTVGLLQLTSMGAQHPAAAEAAHLLRTNSPFISAGAMNAQAELPPAGQGVRVQPLTSQGSFYDTAPSGTTAGPASVPRSLCGFSPEQRDSPPLKAPLSQARRPPTAPLLGR